MSSYSGIWPQYNLIDSKILKEIFGSKIKIKEILIKNFQMKEHQKIFILTVCELHLIIIL